MPAPSAQMTAPEVQALLKDGALAGEWVLNPDRSSIRLTTKSMGLIPVKGAFREVGGHGGVAEDGRVSGTVTVAAASIDTRNKRRDTHLRSADFFNCEAHPDITFTADDARPSGQGVVVTGALTVGGQTRPMSFDATVSVQDGGDIWLDATVAVNRADFGLTWNPLGIVGVSNTLAIHAVFTKW